MKLFVGNLSFDTTENDLEELFQGFGEVTEVALMVDRMTARSRGFAFVTMATAEGANAAIAALEGKPFQGRNLTVNEARPREDRPRGEGRSFDGGGRRSFGGSRGGYSGGRR